MQELFVEARAVTGPYRSLADVPFQNADLEPNRVVFDRRRGEAWQPVTAAQFAQEVAAVTKGLIAAGIEPGDRVALMSRTRYEWTLLDFAIWGAGAIVVPVYETSSAHQVEWILQDSGAHAVFVETDAHRGVVTQVRDNLPALRNVWHIDGGVLDELSSAGGEISDDTLAQSRGTLTRSDLATIIYTSGTTGRPRGCEIVHSNFIDLAENVHVSLPEVVYADEAALLLFLPLAHVLARLIEVTAVMARVRVGHSPDVKNLLPDLASFRPTFLLAVPRVFEKIYNATDTRLTAQGRGRLFTFAARTAIAYSRSLDAGGPSLGLRLQHRALDALVYRKLRALMGGKVTHAVCGGAPLGERLGHFFRGIGVHILEGYGLTETTAPLNVCTPTLTKMGTVGRPLPGVGIAISEDGEILARGIGIFRGYHGNPEATREAFTEDGWFRTGDLGSLDDDGCLRITGRKKEIIVTEGGKNVAPAGLEDVVRAHPLVSQCLVVGDGRPYIAALITIDPEMVESWGAAHGLHDLTVERAHTDETVRTHLQMAVDRANNTVSRAESIRDFDILPGDFLEENGHLTPSMKVRRHAVTADFAADIDALYERGARARR